MKKKIIILIGIALVLIGIIGGSSFAYFTITDNNGNENVITSGNMALRLTDGAVVTTGNMIPGEYIEKEFSVENTGNVASSYDIYLSEVINTFADKTDFVYEITSLDGGYNTPSQVQLPSVSTKIVNQQAIGVGVTHHYKLKITFLAKNENQDDNQGKVFSAKIQINTYENINTTVKYYLDNVEVANQPTQATSNYISSSCNNNANITFNTTTWTYQISNLNQNNTTCNIYFETATVTVTYNAGDGSVNPTSEDVTIGDTLTLPTPTAPEGYDFAGWYTGANGTGTEVTNQTIITSSQTIYAYYQQFKLSLSIIHRCGVGSTKPYYLTYVSYKNDTYPIENTCPNDNSTNDVYRTYNYEIPFEPGEKIIITNNYGPGSWYKKYNNTYTKIFSGTSRNCAITLPNKSLHITIERTYPYSNNQIVYTGYDYYNRLITVDVNDLTFTEN